MIANGSACQGEGTRKIADVLGFCIAAVRRVRQQYKDRGTLEPQTLLCGRNTFLTEKRKERLLQLLADRPDATLAELGAAMRKRAARQAFWAPLSIGLGVTRLQLRMQGREVPLGLPQVKYLRARANEFENIEVSAEQARAAGHIRDKPLVVLTAGRVIDGGLRAALSEPDQGAYEKTWIDDLQVRLAQLSKRGRRILVPDSGHDMPSDRPDAIVAAVREFRGAPEK